MVIRKAFCLLVVGLFASFGRLPAASRADTAQQKLSQTKWSNIHGINFVPIYAKNTYEIWKNYNHAEVDRELGLAAKAGFNSVRLWLNYAAYAHMGSKMVDHVEDVLKLCAKYHLRAVMVLFDSCGVRPRKDTKWLPALQAYDQFQSSSRFTPAQKALMKHLFYNYVHGIGAKVLVPVAPDSPMMAMIWGHWQPTPGNDRLGPAWYPELQKYVAAIVGRFKNDPTIMLWDLMNEPEFASEGPISPTEFNTPQMKKTRDTFLRHFYGYIKKHYPNQLVCEGWASLINAEAYANLADVITFHVYKGPKELRSQINQAQAFSRGQGKPVVITETLANWTFGKASFGKESPELTQLRHYKEVLPILMNSHIGWISFGLVARRTAGPSLAIFSSDGQPRPAGAYLEKTLKAAEASK